MLSRRLVATEDRPRENGSRPDATTVRRRPTMSTHAELLLETFYNRPLRDYRALLVAIHEAGGLAVTDREVIESNAPRADALMILRQANPRNPVRGPEDEVAR